MCEPCAIETDLSKITTLVIWSMFGLAALIILIILLVEEYRPKDWYIDEEGYYQWKKNKNKYKSHRRKERKKHKCK